MTRSLDIGATLSRLPYIQVFTTYLQQNVVWLHSCISDIYCVSKLIQFSILSNPFVIIYMNNRNETLNQLSFV